MNGLVILSFDNTGSKQQTGFAMVLDEDLSLIDTATFGKVQQNILDSLIGDWFKMDGTDNVSFLSRDPDQVSRIYPDSDPNTNRSLFQRNGLNIDRYRGKKAIYDQVFDTVELLKKEAGI